MLVSGRVYQIYHPGNCPIWVFPKIMVPQIIHFKYFNRVFHYFHHPFWGVLPLFLETSISLPSRPPLWPPNSEARRGNLDKPSRRICMSSTWRLRIWTDWMSTEQRVAKISNKNHGEYDAIKKNHKSQIILYMFCSITCKKLQVQNWRSWQR